MALPLCQPLSRQQYETLCSHASRQDDFVFLGSRSQAGERGAAQGFSSHATEQIVLNAAEGEGIDTHGLAEEMDGLKVPYALHHINQSQHTSPFTGGWIGHISYEFGYVREASLRRLLTEQPFPVLFAGLYLWFASEDLNSGNCFLWVHPRICDKQKDRLSGWLKVADARNQHTFTITRPFKATQSSDSFRTKIEEVRHYIDAGDCYQVNLSQSFEGGFKGSPWAGFHALSQANPTPYAAYLRHQDHSVVSVSPERFLHIQNGEIKTSPIKGTRPRGGTPEQDSALAQELTESEKDRAENLMIVDLLRNDLGVNAKPGSVKVDKLFALESYKNVHHLVSHIRAELAEGISPLKAFFDAFPGGSITGAPKIRAMEIIRELEPHWRGPYCGSIFYYGLDGTLDSNIAIRTMLCEKEGTDEAGVEHGTIRCWGGGGIVADSDPESEYQETLTKVKPLMDFLENLNQSD
ncbi:aminodeoxychorismate synthase component I [Marinobacter sp. S6332]|uniref:aminodeoxychorismate synthase component I n=1 Tax=Marinobacter sp. S6332 TaxID=2926403 RepID=UPI001FF2799D|nr:aminodeoxychorismate synthase component I [Marinobacter sp. S6332]MCK0164036.1 aminodeoxychorismate synthase component I [Marinobacter sp. S6332]